MISFGSMLTRKPSNFLHVDPVVVNGERHTVPA